MSGDGSEEPPREISDSAPGGIPDGIPDEWPTGLPPEIQDTNVETDSRLSQDMVKKRTRE